MKIEYDNDNTSLKLYVEGVKKADALTKLLPAHKEFGNVVLNITVIPANYKDDKVSLFRAAFEGNSIVSEIATKDLCGGKVSYVVFEGKVVQFFNDSMADINGLCSTLYQDIANEVFDDHAGIYFCTEQTDWEVIEF